MAENSPANAVAAVAIVILVLVTLVGGYMMFGEGGDKNDIHIDLPGDGRKN